MSQGFSRRTVERSFRKFNDISSDLESAKPEAWGYLFTNLITFCESDPVCASLRNLCDRAKTWMSLSGNNALLAPIEIQPSNSHYRSTMTNEPRYYTTSF
jgi:hypothetical protein